MAMLRYVMGTVTNSPTQQAITPRPESKLNTNANSAAISQVDFSMFKLVDIASPTGMRRSTIKQGANMKSPSMIKVGI